MSWLWPMLKTLRFWEIMSWVAFFMGLGLIGVYSASLKDSLQTFGFLSLIGMSAWLAASVIGFLFGVPRLRATPSQPDPNTNNCAYVPNTNLEQISDWLTKIIIGATLVQIKSLATGLNNLCLSVGGEIGAQTGPAVSLAIILLFGSAGFIWGYLWCSLRIFREMVDLIGREQALRASENI